MESSYRPVSCEFVDWIEHYATLRLRIPIEYHDEQGIQKIKAVIKTWYREEGMEYMQLKTGESIRLDKVIQLGEAKNGGTCSL